MVESDFNCFEALPQNAYFFHSHLNLISLPFEFLELFISNTFFREILYVEKALETAWDWLKAVYEKRLKLTESALNHLKALQGGFKRFTEKRF